MKRIAATALFSVALWGQTVRPSYDVASVKLNTSESDDSGTHGSTGQIVFENQTLARLIERAYSVAPAQVMGPDWLQKVHVDITAKYPPDTKSEDRWPMLRTLLENRFKLAVHRESREMQGYALVVAKSGFKLKPVDPGDGSTDRSGSRIQTLTARKASITRLCERLASLVNAVVVDQTGLDGVYDFEFTWTDDLNGNITREGKNIPSIFEAIEEKLGLRLQAQKVHAEMVVVDHVERVPTGN